MCVCFVGGGGSTTPPWSPLTRAHRFLLLLSLRIVTLIQPFGVDTADIALTVPCHYFALLWSLPIVTYRCCESRPLQEQARAPGDTPPLRLPLRTRCSSFRIFARSPFTRASSRTVTNSTSSAAQVIPFVTLFVPSFLSLFCNMVALYKSKVARDGGQRNRANMFSIVIYRYQAGAAKEPYLGVLLPAKEP